MSTPNPLENTNAPTLEDRVKSLEERAVADVRGSWRSVDAFFWTVLSHVKSISYVAVMASLTVFVLKLYHNIGL